MTVDRDALRESVRVWRESLEYGIERGDPSFASSCMAPEEQVEVLRSVEALLSSQCSTCADYGGAIFDTPDGLSCGYCSSEGTDVVGSDLRACHRPREEATE